MRPTIFVSVWLTYDIVRVAIPFSVCDHRRWTYTRWGGSLVIDTRVLVTGEASVRAVDIDYCQHNTNEKFTALHMHNNSAYT